MKIKKIIVDEKPKSCSECYFRGIPDTTVIPEVYSCDLFDWGDDMFDNWDCPLYKEEDS